MVVAVTGSSWAQAWPVACLPINDDCFVGPGIPLTLPYVCSMWGLEGPQVLSGWSEPKCWDDGSHQYGLPSGNRRSLPP